MRWRWWAASRPSIREPSDRRSKWTPAPVNQATTSGAASTTRRATASSTRPAPAATVSAAWSAGRSSAPTAAAMPPWAQGLEPPRPGTSSASTTTPGRPAPVGAAPRRWPSSRAADSPATPAPTTTARTCSMRTGSTPAGRAGGTSAASVLTSALRWPPSISPPATDGQHPLDRAPGPFGHGGLDEHLGGHRLQRAADAAQRDALHVGTEVAGPHELGAGRLERHVVGHRALGHHHHPLGLAALHDVDHPGGGAHVVGLGQHVGRALGMGDDLQTRRLGPVAAQVGTCEALVHHAGAFPEDEVDP